MGRKESQRNILDREMSVKDICRSEKHYLNVAFDSESPDLSDDEGDFMVQVNLGDGTQKKKSPSTVSITPGLSVVSILWLVPCVLIGKNSLFIDEQYPILLQHNHRTGSRRDAFVYCEAWSIYCASWRL